jgi:hypothetical protein
LGVNILSLIIAPILLSIFVPVLRRINPEDTKISTGKAMFGLVFSDFSFISIPFGYNLEFLLLSEVRKNDIFFGVGIVLLLILFGLYIGVQLIKPEIVGNKPKIIINLGSLLVVVLMLAVYGMYKNVI